MGKWAETQEAYYGRPDSFEENTGRVLPILFNTEMVQAILDGRKTVTRRALKHPFEVHPNGFVTKPRGNERLCPYTPPYQPDDILYVRETWAKSTDLFGEFPEYVYRTDYGTTEDDSFPPSMFKWHPSIHMPKEAARIWLKVTDVRVERLHDMTLDDFLAEGVVIRPEAFNDPENAYMQARSEFARIWDSTTRKSQTVLNPWVWVIEFERCEKTAEVEDEKS